MTSLVKVFPPLGVCLALSLRFSDFPLRPDDDDRDRGSAQAILGNAAHPWRTQRGSPSLDHTPLASCPDDYRFGSVQRDQPIDVIGHLPRDEFDPHGHLTRW